MTCADVFPKLEIALRRRIRFRPFRYSDLPVTDTVKLQFASGDPIAIDSVRTTLYVQNIHELIAEKCPFREFQDISRSVTVICIIM